MLEYVADDKSKAAAGLFRLAGDCDDTYLLRFRGLDAGRSYRVTLDNTGESFYRDGATLIHQGLPVCLERPLTSELILLQEGNSNEL